MTIFSALNVGISGLNAQSNSISATSDNIANVNTTGYKQTVINFADLVSSEKPAYYNPGGVTSDPQDLVDVQGIITSTASTTDLAISGNGFFPVSDSPSGTDGLLFTRSGSFTQDKDGNFVNGPGFYLQGLRLDANGNPVAGATTASLVPVNVSGLTETSVPTDSVIIKANLQASQPVSTATYDPTDPTENMASGSVAPDFTIPTTIVDSNGVKENVVTGFLKTGTNTWAVEIYAQDASAATTPNNDGQFAAGTVTFNGDGTPATIDPALQNVTATWASGATNTVAFNFGTAGAQFGTPGATLIGKTDGLTQLDTDYTITTNTPNGYTSGNLTSVSIDDQGFVSGVFDNGTTQRFYQIPLVDFRNPEGLTSETGNVYAESTDSGTANLVSIGTDGDTKLDVGALESSNVDISNELTNLIVAQRAYEANTKTISTTDAMLQTLTSMGTT